MNSDGFALDGGMFLPRREILRPKLIVPSGPMFPCQAIEEIWGDFDRLPRNIIGKMLLKLDKFREETIEDIVRFAGSLAFQSSKKLQDSLFGATAFTAAGTIYHALYTAAIDDTLLGNTASEITYTSYARLATTNNTTIYAAGTGTTTYQKQFPSDATKSWATATANANNPATYLGGLSGNAGTSADLGYYWCSVTSTTINNGDTPQLAQNAVTVTQD